jgi:hypothetical protein
MEKKMNCIKQFKYRICSDLDYEGMVVDVVYNGEILAILNMDKGSNNIEIKVFEPVKEYWEFKLDDFMETLQKAKKLLIEVNEKPEE